MLAHNHTHASNLARLKCHMTYGLSRAKVLSKIGFCCVQYYVLFLEASNLPLLEIFFFNHIIFSLFQSPVSRGKLTACKSTHIDVTQLIVESVMTFIFVCFVFLFSTEKKNPVSVLLVNRHQRENK